MGILNRWLLITLILVACAPLLALPRILYPASSMVLPGSGEIMLGRTTKGGTMMAIDILSLYALLATNQAIDLQKKQYMNFAERYAGVPYGMSDNHYQDVQDYISSDYYNDIIRMMARNYYLIANYSPEDYEAYVAENSFAGDEQWSWDSDDHWQQYKHMRKSNQKRKMSHNLALGIMLLNRAVSTIDATLLTRPSRHNGQVYFTPSGDTGLMLNYGFNF